MTSGAEDNKSILEIPFTDLLLLQLVLSLLFVAVRQQNVNDGHFEHFEHWQHCSHKVKVWHVKVCHVLFQT